MDRGAAARREAHGGAGATSSRATPTASRISKSSPSESPLHCCKIEPKVGCEGGPRSREPQRRRSGVPLGGIVVNWVWWECVGWRSTRSSGFSASHSPSLLHRGPLAEGDRCHQGQVRVRIGAPCDAAVPRNRRTERNGAMHGVRDEALEKSRATGSADLPPWEEPSVCPRRGPLSNITVRSPARAQ
jgi:hypothetical protein